MATIYFYKLDYLIPGVKIDKNKQAVANNTYLGLKDFEDDFKSILNKNIKNNCLLLDEMPDWCLLQILETGNNITEPIKCDKLDNCDYIFARLGKKKDINDIERRNKKNFKTNDIQKDDDEDIEIFTYFYIIFERTEGKVVIIYLASQYAPNINKLESITEKYAHHTNRKIEISPVITKNVTKVLKKKDIVNSFSYRVSIPSDKILGVDGIGLCEEAYDNLINVKSTDIVVTITAQRNKNLFKAKNSLERFKDKVFKTSSSKVKDFLAKAKNAGGSLLPYHFLDNEFIEKATFNYSSNDGDKRIQEIKDTLLKKYVMHRRELLDYMK